MIIIIIISIHLKSLKDYLQSDQDHQLSGWRAEPWNIHWPCPHTAN